MWRAEEAVWFLCVVDLFVVFCLRTGRTEVFWRAQRAGGCTAAENTHTWNQGSYACARELLSPPSSRLPGFYSSAEVRSTPKKLEVVQIL